MSGERSFSGCAICGIKKIHLCHVKPNADFRKEGDSNDRVGNIIPLCPTHHTFFDDLHTIGILPDKSGFLIDEGDVAQRVPSRVNLRHVKDEYILERNLTCTRHLRFRLGLIPGSRHGKMC